MSGNLSTRSYFIDDLTSWESGKCTSLVCVKCYSIDSSQCFILSILHKVDFHHQFLYTKHTTLINSTNICMTSADEQDYKNIKI